MKKRTYTLIGARNIFSISILVIGLTVCGVNFWGLGEHGTFFDLGMISTTILSTVFFLFTTVALYRGIKLKDDVGRYTDNIKLPDFSTMPNISPNASVDLDIDGDDGCVGAIVAIILWAVLAFFLSILLWFFGQVVWVILIAFTGMLYWIFFRALRLVFKNSNKSKGRLLESMRLGVLYTFLYNFWIYGIFILTDYLKS